MTAAHRALRAPRHSDFVTPAAGLGRGRAAGGRGRARSRSTGGGGIVGAPAAVATDEPFAQREGPGETDGDHRQRSGRSRTLCGAPASAGAHPSLSGAGEARPCRRWQQVYARAPACRVAWEKSGRSRLAGPRHGGGGTAGRDQSGAPGRTPAGPLAMTPRRTGAGRHLPASSPSSARTGGPDRRLQRACKNSCRNIVCRKAGFTGSGSGDSRAQGRRRLDLRGTRGIAGVAGRAGASAPVALARPSPAPRHPGRKRRAQAAPCPRPVPRRRAAGAAGMGASGHARRERLPARGVGRARPARRRRDAEHLSGAGSGRVWC